MKRKITYRALQESDFRWLWAAYGKGAFLDVPRGLDLDQFVAAAYDRLNRFSEQFLVETDRPIGLILTLTDGYRFEPHAEWFPWASQRNRMTGALTFLNRERKDRLGVIYMDMSGKTFLEHLAKYGVLRRVGTVFDFFEPDSNAVLFQTRKAA